MSEYKLWKRKSKEYKQYIDNVIEQYNSNGKKTLLFVADNAYPMVDGVWRVLSNCATQLSKNGTFNVMIFCPGTVGDVYIKDVPILACRSSYLKSLQYQLALPQFDVQSKRWLKKLRIDIIHCHSPFFCGLMARKLHLKRNIPMVSTFHSQFRQDFLKATKSKSLTRFGMRTIMKVFRDSDEVWTMHNASRDTLYSYGYKGKCRLVPNATGMKPIADYDAAHQRFRDEHGLTDEVVFIFSGRLITQKGILFIPEVLQGLKARGVKFKMFFVGDGCDEKKLRAKVKACDVEDDVVFVGAINDPQKLVPYYVGADLFLFPSRYDVSSIVQIEAATYKTPTVFVEGSVTSNTVTDGVNGYLLPFEREAYTDGVYKILSQQSWREVGENALRDLHIEWEDVVADCEKYYHELID